MVPLLSCQLQILGPGDFSGLQPADCINWRLAEQHGLWIVDDHFATELFETGEIPPGLVALRITELPF